MYDPKERDEWDVFLEEEAERERRRLDEECQRVPGFLSVTPDEGEEDSDEAARDMAKDMMDDVLRRLTGLDG
jgi:hypothetical protein